MTVPLPAPRLALLVALAAGALALLPELGTVRLGGVGLDGRFVALNGALAAIALLDGLAAPPPGAVAVERQHPRAVTLDQPAAITWEVSSASRRRWGSARRVWLADQLPPSLHAAARRVIRPARVLRPSGVVRLVRHVHPSRPSAAAPGGRRLQRARGVECYGTRCLACAASSARD